MKEHVFFWSVQVDLWGTYQVVIISPISGEHKCHSVSHKSIGKAKSSKKPIGVSRRLMKTNWNKKRLFQDLK